jgi:hypothetical protein
MTRYSAAHFALIRKDIQAWVNLFAEDSAWLFDRPNLSFLPKIWVNSEHNCWLTNASLA